MHIFKMMHCVMYTYCKHTFTSTAISPQKVSDFDNYQHFIDM